MRLWISTCSNTIFGNIKWWFFFLIITWYRWDFYFISCMAAHSFRTSKDTDLRNEDFYGFVNDATFLSLAGERAREFCSDRLWRAEAAEGENKTTDMRNKTLISVPCKTNPSPSLLRLLGPSIPLFFFWLSGRWKNFTLDKVWCIFWKHWTGGELVSSVALWVGENGFLEKCFVFFWDKFGRGFRRGQRLSASWWTLLTSGDGKIQKLSYLLKNDIYIYLFPLSTVEVFQATQNSPSSTILFLMRL